MRRRCDRGSSHLQVGSHRHALSSAFIPFLFKYHSRPLLLMGVFCLPVQVCRRYSALDQAVVEQVISELQDELAISTANAAPTSSA